MNWTDELNIIFWIVLCYLGLGILWSIASSSSLFTINVPKKQSNIRISRYYKRNDLAISFDKTGDVMC